MAERHAAPGELPLFRWGAELRRTVETRRRLRRRLAAGAAGLLLLGATIVESPSPRLVWNVSASAPVGLYRVTPGAALARGDMVIAWTPEPYRRLAAERRYLPINVPLVKRIAAVPGDHVCAIGESLYIDGRRVVSRLPEDGAGRPMPQWTGCAQLAAGQYLLLMDEAPASFDGRYFGPVEAGQIVGRAVPLWVG